MARWLRLTMTTSFQTYTYTHKRSLLHSIGIVCCIAGNPVGMHKSSVLVFHHRIRAVCLKRRWRRTPRYSPTKPSRHIALNRRASIVLWAPQPRITTLLASPFQLPIDNRQFTALYMARARTTARPWNPAICLLHHYRTFKCNIIIRFPLLLTNIPLHFLFYFLSRCWVPNRLPT